MVTPPPLPHTLIHTLASRHVATDASFHWLSCLRKRRCYVIHARLRGILERNETESGTNFWTLVHPNPTVRSLTLKTLVVFSDWPRSPWSALRAEVYHEASSLERTGSYKSFSGDLTIYSSPKLLCQNGTWLRLLPGEIIICFWGSEEQRSSVSGHRKMASFFSLSSCLSLISGKQVPPWMTETKQSTATSGPANFLFIVEVDYFLETPRDILTVRSQSTLSHPVST